MKTIIAGSRNAEKTRSYYAIGLCMGAMVKKGRMVTEIVSGGASGVDTFAQMIAKEYGFPLKVMNADWDKYGRKAGYIRNSEMAEYADALIAIWDGKSPGTKMMIDIAQKKGMPVEIYRLDLPWTLEKEKS